LADVSLIKGRPKAQKITIIRNRIQEKGFENEHILGPIGKRGAKLGGESISRKSRKGVKQTEKEKPRWGSLTQDHRPDRTKPVGTWETGGKIYDVR